VTRPSAWRRIAARVLEWAERMYLQANGWDAHGDGGWVPPDDYDFRRHDFYTRCHAVNAQRQRRVRA
jgi:hypothetical protein